MVENDCEVKFDHRAFNPWRRPASENAQRLCAYTCAELEEHEMVNQLRKRQRKEKDQAVFEQTVAALVCNVLFHAIICGNENAITEDDAIHIPLSNRYLGTGDPQRSPVLSKALPDIVKRLSACGFLDMTGGHQGCAGFDIPPQQTKLQPTHLLIDLATGKKATKAGEIFKLSGLHDFKEDRAEQEAVALHLPKEKRGQQKSGKTVALPQTAQVKSLKKNMKIINDWLEQAPITAKLSCWEDSTGRRHIIDDRARFLIRRFSNGRFDSGGRLYGGFWQTLSKEKRREAILIAGEEVCTLDYGQMALRILYGIKRKTPPSQDCYEITGYAPYREGIKKILNTATFMDKIPSRFPNETRQYLPKAARIAEACEAILKFHSSVKDWLFTDSNIGHELQNVESNIMVDLLLTIKNSGVPAALPVHDAVIIPVSYVPAVKKIMKDIFRKHTGSEAIINKD